MNVPISFSTLMLYIMIFETKAFIHKVPQYFLDIQSNLKIHLRCKDLVFNDTNKIIYTKRSVILNYLLTISIIQSLVRYRKEDMFVALYKSAVFFSFFRIHT